MAVGHLGAKVIASLVHVSLRRTGNSIIGPLNDRPNQKIARSGSAELFVSVGVDSGAASRFTGHSYRFSGAIGCRKSHDFCDLVAVIVHSAYNRLKHRGDMPALSIPHQSWQLRLMLNWISTGLPSTAAFA
jgi:N-acetylmuramoyl-L-alanine amidase